MTPFPYLALGLVGLVVLIICTSLLASLTHRVSRLERNEEHFIETVRALGALVIEASKRP